ncbi:MAG: hypothetical protein LBM95_08240 [Lactobacillales bacterium]|jgi:hypothetical protein|nr:hypothetical protein [Lactobacillales bacterium]
MKNFFKILLIGLITTIFRIVIQLLMPSSTQTVLSPSQFVKDGTLPLAFSALAIVAYSVIAAMFLLVKSGISGTSMKQGLKYAVSLSFLWSVYLFEPLPHSISILKDSIAYVLTDSISLILMGLLLGVFFKSEEKIHGDRINNQTLLLLFVPTILFVLGRLIQYKVLGIYSSFDGEPLKTILWCITVGVVSSLVVSWLVKQGGSVSKGLFIYAMNLFFFNSFMLLVFDFSVVDLTLRTGIDIVAISIGIIVISRNKNFIEMR